MEQNTHLFHLPTQRLFRLMYVRKKLYHFRNKVHPGFI